MKRLFMLALLMSLSIGTFAQKNYIFVRAGSYSDTKYNIRLSGSLPSNMQNSYIHTEIADVLNKLSENGYDLFSCYAEEKMSILIFTKNESNTVSAVRSVESEEDSDVYEVARYNLQGIPISEREKGIQIVVYSNYTTKTIIRE